MRPAIVGVYLDAADAGLIVQLIDAFGTHQRNTGGRPLHGRVLALRAELSRPNARVSDLAQNVSSNVSPVGVQRDPVQSGLYALIDSSQAAAILGCTTGNVRDLARRGQIAARRVAGRWAYNGLDVERIAAERAHGLRR